MRNNQIINSSIIINIIVNGKNKTTDETSEPTTMSDWSTTDVAGDYVDPGFWMHVEDTNLEKFQKPDYGLLKVNDRHDRIFKPQDTTTKPEATPT
jgi:hypothetical protein